MRFILALSSRAEQAQRKIQLESNERTEYDLEDIVTPRVRRQRSKTEGSSTAAAKKNVIVIEDEDEDTDDGLVEVVEATHSDDTPDAASSSTGEDEVEPSLAVPASITRYPHADDDDDDYDNVRRPSEDHDNDPDYRDLGLLSFPRNSLPIRREDRRESEDQDNDPDTEDIDPPSRRPSEDEDNDDIDDEIPSRRPSEDQDGEVETPPVNTRRSSKLPPSRPSFVRILSAVVEVEEYVDFLTFLVAFETYFSRIAGLLSHLRTRACILTPRITTFSVRP